MFWYASIPLQVLQRSLRSLNTLYLYINIGSILVPFLVSFHPLIRLYKDWKALFCAILLSMFPFIVWDVWFTVKGYWGFNALYITGYHFLSLPIEEWLFFICIPYACVFTHLSMTILLPRFKFNEGITKRTSSLMLAMLALMALFNYDKWYTFVNFSYGFVILSWVMLKDFALLKSYFWTFLVILIPFFVVNGILTGSWIKMR